ncbi:glycosyltransferase family 4 protein [Ralstonia sp. 25C]|uniref:glycosyltransferase family 4 protein n=1 Tax=Ralstonia sp. 25C TaxID=3447363 RepID=UPI003F755806
MPATSPSDRPRVAYLITNSETGGAQAHVADLLQALRDRVEPVLLAGGNGPLFAAAEAVGVKTIPLTRLDNALSPIRAIAALWQLMRALRTAKPDLIHAHSAKAGILGRLAGALLGIPVIYTVHGFAFKPAAPVPQRFVAHTAEWLLAPFATHMICVANAERALTATLPIAASRISVIHNGIASSNALATPDAPVRRIVMVARLAAPKRGDLLIRAFASAALPDCELVLAGEGPQQSSLQALADSLAPGRVRFAGAVTDVPALLASAQIFALASDHEGFPISILEAMRAGLPVIASDLPGIREQFEGGTCGVLVSNNDEQAWTSALMNLAKDATLRANLGQKAQTRWRQAFGVDSMADSTWQVYVQALTRTAKTHRLAARPTAGEQ